MIIATPPLRRLAVLSLAYVVALPAAHGQGLEDPAAIDREVAVKTIRKELLSSAMATTIATPGAASTTTTSLPDRRSA